MGSFFTSTQILNASNLSKEEITKIFHDMMKKDDYVICEADEGELSYAFSFADNSKWVTMSSESYNEVDKKASKDMSTIARIFKTVCLKTVVIDSDLAIIDLFDSKGNKADTLVMGRADEYMGDDMQAPEKAMWESLMVENATWEKFTSVQQGDYTFVEEGLSLLAPLIGIDSNNILMDYDDLCSASEKNQNAFYLYFKKANKKTLTLNAAFKKVFGEALEPLGFVKTKKTKNPYFIRVINKEIIHIIGFSKKYGVLGAVATIYRPEFNLNQIDSFNHDWILRIGKFYEYSHPYDFDLNYRNSLNAFKSSIYESDKIMINAFEKTMKWILPVLDNVNTLYDVIDYLVKFWICSGRGYIYDPENPRAHQSSEADGSLLFLLDDPYSFEERIGELTIEKILCEKERNIGPYLGYNTIELCDEIKKSTKKRNKLLAEMLNNKENYDKILAELERRKTQNIEILKSYGVDLK